MRTGLPKVVREETYFAMFIAQLKNPEIFEADLQEVFTDQQKFEFKLNLENEEELQHGFAVRQEDRF